MEMGNGQGKEQPIEKEQSMEKEPPIEEEEEHPKEQEVANIANIAVFSARTSSSSMADQAKQKIETTIFRQEIERTLFLEPKVEKDSEMEEVVENDQIIKDKNIFICDFCPKSFGTKTKKRVHKTKMHPYMAGEGEIVCDLCSSYFSKDYMVAHMKKKHPKEAVSEHSSLLTTEDDEDAVRTECQLCPKAFGGKAFLDRHIKLKHPEQFPNDETTTDEKLEELPQQMDPIDEAAIANVVMWQCDQCQKYFSSNTTLKNHMVVTHMEENPYKCQYCEKEFTKLGGMRAHIKKSHTDGGMEPTSVSDFKDEQ